MVGVDGAVDDDRSTVVEDGAAGDLEAAAALEAAGAPEVAGAPEAATVSVTSVLRSEAVVVVLEPATPLGKEEPPTDVQATVIASKAAVAVSAERRPIRCAAEWGMHRTVATRLRPGVCTILTPTRGRADRRGSACGTQDLTHVTAES